MHSDDRAAGSTSAEAFSTQLQAARLARSREFVFRDEVTGTELQQLSSLNHLEVVELHRCSFESDALADFVTQLPELRKLRADGCAAGDDVMQAIGSCEKLETLNLADGEFTDVGLRAVARLPNLFLLRFQSRNVTDAGLAELAQAPALRFLHLLYVPITDRGLGSFHKMEQLESFYIDGGNESEAGIIALLKSNPHLHFHRNQLHVPDDPNADEH